MTNFTDSDVQAGYKMVGFVLQSVQYKTFVDRDDDGFTVDCFCKDILQAKIFANKTDADKYAVEKFTFKLIARRIKLEIYLFNEDES